MDLSHFCALFCFFYKRKSAKMNCQSAPSEIAICTLSTFLYFILLRYLLTKFLAVEDAAVTPGKFRIPSTIPRLCGQTGGVVSSIHLAQISCQVSSGADTVAVLPLCHCTRQNLLKRLSLMYNQGRA